MFRRTNAAFNRMKKVREERKAQAAGRASVTTPNPSSNSTTTTNSKTNSTSLKSKKAKKKTNKKDETDEFEEWRANEKRKENINKKKLHRGGAPANSEEKLSCRELFAEPEAHVLFGIILITDLIFYLYTLWKNAAMSEAGGLPIGARQDIMNSQGLALMSSISKWLSIFAIFLYCLEQVLSLFFNGLTLFFTSARVIDFTMWSGSSIFLLMGGTHYPLFNVPRIIWRVYMVCTIYIARASTSTDYYRQKCIKLKQLAQRQRKQMIEMITTSKTMEKEIDNHKNHISELERALLIAAESEAVRMDLGTLTSYAQEGSKNKEDFAF